MSPQQKYFIRKSFAQLEDYGNIAALVFYRRLFELDRALRPLFKNNIEEHAAKLTEMLGALISRMEQTDPMESELRQMGQRHANYGVLPAHYETVGTALPAMLEETLRADFTKPVREAWTTLYGALAEAMQAGAAAVRAE